MVKKLITQVGRAYSFLYPRHNYIGVPPKLELRTVKVTKIQDMTKEGVDPSAVEENPTLNRGRWLITGDDLDKGGERSFYLESMEEIREVDPDEQPTAKSEYAVLDRMRVEFLANSVGEGLAFMAGARRGVLCKVLSGGHPESAICTSQNP